MYTFNGNKVHIFSPKGFPTLNLKELFHYRELLFFFAWRDIKVRYKQTVIGIAWALIQPLLTMLVFSVFFGKFAKVPSEGVPYPIFVYVGLLPWTFFAQGISRCSESLAGNAALVRKVFFPRMIAPLAAGIFGLADFFMACIILIGMMIYYKFTPSVMALGLPILFLLTWMWTTALGLWLSASNVLYRDIRYILPYFVQLGMFLTPVIYPVSMVPDNYQWLLYLNPMAGLIETYRAVVIGYKVVPWTGFIISTIVIFATFFSGIFYFRKVEHLFADYI